MLMASCGRLSWLCAQGVMSPLAGQMFFRCANAIWTQTGRRARAWLCMLFGAREPSHFRLHASRTQARCCLAKQGNTVWLVWGIQAVAEHKCGRHHPAPGNTGLLQGGRHDWRHCGVHGGPDRLLQEPDPVPDHQVQNGPRVQACVPTLLRLHALDTVVAECMSVQWVMGARCCREGAV